MQEIITEQGGNPAIDSEDLKPGKFAYKVRADKSGTIKNISSKNLTIIAKLLGVPKQKGAGIFLDKKIGELAHKGNVIYTLYSEKVYNLKRGKGALARFPIAKI